MGRMRSDRLARNRDRRASQSFLIRFWHEPREVDGQPRPIRGYLRDLQTGEERLIRDPEEIGALIVRLLEARAYPGSIEATAAAGDRRGS